MLKLLQISFSVILLIIVLAKSPIKEIGNSFTKINLYFFALALLFSLAAWAINTKKWQFLLKKINVSMPFSVLLMNNLLSIIYSMVLPGQFSGEIAKMFKASKKQTEKIKIIASVIIDKTTGMLILFGINIFTLSLTNLYFPQLFAPISAISATGILIIVFSFRQNIYSTLRNITKKYGLDKKFLLKRFDSLSSLSSNYFYLTRFDILLKTILLSLMFQFLATISFVFALKSFNINIGFLESLWIFSLVSIVLFVPISLAGLGVREGTLIFTLAIFHIPPERAISASLAILMISIILGASGLLLEILHNSKLKKIRDSGAK